MKAWLAALMVVASTAWADTTANLITNQPGVSGTCVWTGIGGYSQLGGQHPITLWGCCTSYSGSAPFLDTSTGSPNGQSGQIIWSYGQATVQQIIAVNQALAAVGAGVQISGYNWGYEVRNMNGDDRQSSVDTLTATTFMTDSAGAIILSDTRVYNTKTEWNWYGGTVSAASPIDLASAGNLGIRFTSMDSGFWGGYYGPQVRNVDLSLNYTASPVDPCVADPQSSPTCAGYRTYYNMTDDGFAQVNLPFAFPFYGQVFTTSYMYTNGVVGFLNNNWGFCCDGTDLDGQVYAANSPWRYAIYALNTDLYPGANSQFYTQQTNNGTGIKYTWQDVVEIGTTNTNTFHVEIRDTGFIGITYDQINLSDYRQPLIGIAGDISQGQYDQKFYNTAINLAQINLTTPASSGWRYEFSGTEITDVCALDPLWNTACAGYAQAYFNQQCSISALYDSTCPGYAQAYHDQQCSINALYATTCTGYAQAYYDQQCAANPLYDSACPGYQQAYFDQQCGLDPFYDTACPGYAQAYYDQQCAANPLYDSGCDNYDIVYEATQPPAQEDTTTVVAQADTAASSSSASEPTAATSPTSPTSVSPAAVVSTVRPIAPAAAPAPSGRAQSTENARQETRAAEQKQEQKKTDRAVARAVPRGTTGQAAQKAAADKAEEAVADAAAATTIEAQQAAQSLVLGLMGYNPAFSAYQNSIVPDTNAAVMARQYNQPTVDNRRALRGLSGASDSMHQDMVDQQYGRMP
jgi:hypothetical protein